MTEKNSFQETLLSLIADDEVGSILSARQLASLAEVPDRTMANWLKGRVQRPRNWRPLVSLADALFFSLAEVNELLKAAGHPTIAELRDTVTSEEDQDRLLPWPPPLTPFRADDDLPYFTGRDDEIERLEEWLSQEQFVGPLRLAGMPGVGKTSLAAHVAHKFSSLFPNGVLWADLDKADVMSTLSQFAEDLGHDISEHKGLGSRKRAFKDILRRRRVLIILDNARSGQDVQPFLPHYPSPSAVIITTRHRDLGMTQTAHPLYLEEFTEQEAFALFAEILDDERLQKEGERAALEEIADYFDYLPIALDIVARQLKKWTERTAEEYFAGLQKEGERLDHLTTRERSVQSLFEAGYKSLTFLEKQFFAALGAFRGRDFDARAAAAATDLSLRRAEDLLIALRDLSLVKEARAKRFRLHSLISDYAISKLTDRRVHNRLIEYYVTYAEENVRDYETLALESENIIAAIEEASDRGTESALLKGANALYHYWNTRGLYGQAVDWLKEAERIARAQGDVRSLTLALRSLGHFELELGNTDASEKYLEKGLSLARSMDEPTRLAQILNVLGIFYDRAGRFEEAETHYLESLALSQKTGDLRRTCKLLLNLGGLASDMGKQELAEARLQKSLELARQLDDADLLGTIFNNLGAVAGRKGDFEAEEQYYKKALAAARQTRNRLDICYRLANLGALSNTKGDFTQAQRYLTQALEVAHGMRHPERISTIYRLLAERAIALQEYSEAEDLLQKGLSHAEGAYLTISESALLANLGLVMTFRRNYEQARRHFKRSLALAREAGHAWYLADALNKMGELYLSQGEEELATALFDEALERSRKAETVELEADALFGQARVAAMRGLPDEALELAKESLTLFEELGHYKANEVREWISSLQK